VQTCSFAFEICIISQVCHRLLCVLIWWPKLQGVSWILNYSLEYRSVMEVWEFNRSKRVPIEYGSMGVWSKCIERFRTIDQRAGWSVAKFLQSPIILRLEKVCQVHILAVCPYSGRTPILRPYFGTPGHTPEIRSVLQKYFVSGCFPRLFLIYFMLSIARVKTFTGPESAFPPLDIH
jgi:hypothetical protein